MNMAVSVSAIFKRVDFFIAVKIKWLIVKKKLLFAYLG